METIIARNQTLFANDEISFRIFKRETDLPSANLFICKDVFQHLPNQAIQNYVRMFKARAQFVLITNDDWPAEHLTNAEIDEGSSPKSRPSSFRG